jgi:hypothetical protein
MLHKMSAAREAAPPEPERTIYGLLAFRARQAPRGRLLEYVVWSINVALGIGALGPRMWLLITPLICLASFGAWGLLAQQMDELAATGDRPALRITCQAAEAMVAAVGTAAAVVGFLGAFLLVLGPSWNL